MKNKMYQAAILAVLGLASVSAVQAASYNGDLLIGLTTQSGNDVVYDLGSYSSLTYGETWDLSSAISAAGLSLTGSTLWGIIGAQNVSGTRYAYITGNSANSIPGITAWNKINTGVATIYNSLSTAGAGNYGTPSSSLTYSWNQQTAQGGAATGTAFSAVSANPNSTGFNYFQAIYQQVAGGSPATDVGGFSLSSAGVLTFETVPEPGTYAMMAVGGGFLMLVGRNKFGRKQQS